MTKRLDAYLDLAIKGQLDNVACFVGLGNHGGGPTRRHLDEIAAWAKQHQQVKVVFSGLHKFFDALKSQGLPVGKNTLHDYLAHLEDAFLVRTVSLHTASERQRMVNPRKAYPIDPGLISLYERAGRANLGHALETVVLLELERRGDYQ